MIGMRNLCQGLMFEEANLFMICIKFAVIIIAICEVTHKRFRTNWRATNFQPPQEGAIDKVFAVSGGGNQKTLPKI